MPCAFPLSTWLRNALITKIFRSIGDKLADRKNFRHVQRAIYLERKLLTGRIDDLNKLGERAKQISGAEILTYESAISLVAFVQHLSREAEATTNQPYNTIYPHLVEHARTCFAKQNNEFIQAFYDHLGNKHSEFLPMPQSVRADEIFARIKSSIALLMIDDACKELGKRIDTLSNLNRSYENVLSNGIVNLLVKSVRDLSQDIAHKTNQPYDTIYRQLVEYVQKRMDEQTGEEFKRAFREYVTDIAPEFLPAPKLESSAAGSQYKPG